MENIEVIFFDLGETLGRPKLDTRGGIDRFDVFPGIPALLDKLRTRGILLGIISNTGDIPGRDVAAVLDAAGIGEAFEPVLSIFSSDVGLTKDSPAIFRLALARAERSETPQSCLFVGEDPDERTHAEAAGMQTSDAPARLDGDPLCP